MPDVLIYYRSSGFPAKSFRAAASSCAGEARRKPLSRYAETSSLCAAARLRNKEMRGGMQEPTASEVLMSGAAHARGG